MPSLGYKVIVADYRGYGANAGTPSEDGLIKDAHAFVQLAREQAHGLPVFIVGHSLGGAVALQMAASEDVSGLVTLATFTRLGDMAPWGSAWLLPDSFDNLALASRIRVPWISVHGQKDEVVPYDQGLTLAEEADNEGAPKFRFIAAPGRRHMDVFDELPGAMAQLEKLTGG